MVGLGFSVYSDCESLVGNRLSYGQLFSFHFIFREFVTLDLLPYAGLLRKSNLRLPK